jgi:autotransporter-associated beta strand protein
MKTPPSPARHLISSGLASGQYSLSGSRRALVVLAVALGCCLPARAGSVTWDASGANPAAPTDGAGTWDPSVARWSNGSADNGWNTGDSAVIGANNGSAGIISITNTAGVTVGNVTYNGAGSGNYNVSGNTLILTGSPTITVANGVIVTNATVLGGTGFTKAGNGRLVLQPPAANTNVGPVTINAGTVQVAATSVVSLNDDVTVNSGASLLISASVGMVTNRTLTINGGSVTNLGVSGNSTETHGRIIFDNNGLIACAGTVIGQLNVSNLDLRNGLVAFPKFPSTMITNCTVKSTPGTAIVQSRANSAGVNGMFVTVNAGTMIADYPNPAPNGDSTGGAKFINAANVPLTLGGGALFFRYNAAANRTENVGGALILPGATSLQMTNSGANNIALAQNTITRRVGGTVNYTKAALGSGTANFTTTSANVNGILSGGITWAATDWAVGTTIAALAAGSYQADLNPANWGATSNVTLNASTSSSVGDGTNINSLRLTGSSAVTLGGTLTLSSGGLLVTGSGANSITGGTLKGGSGTDLIVHQYSSGDLTINSTLADNGTATSLTKSGTGKLVLACIDNLTGTNYLNGGTVEVNDLAQLASGPLVMNNGALRYTGSDASSSRAIIVNGIGGIIDVAGSTKLTQTAAIVGGGGVNSPLDGANMGDWGGLTKIGSGTLILATNNVYNGPTIVSNGVLSVNGTNSLSGTSGLTNYLGGGVFTVYGGTLGGTGMISGPVTVKNGGTISPGNSPGTLTLANSLTMETGSTGLFEVAISPGASDLLVVNGNLTINSGSTISISVLGDPLVAGTYTLIQYSGTKTGSFNSTPIIVSGSIDGSFAIDDSTAGQINLVVTHPVTITSQPSGTNIVDGQAFTVSVAATGTAPLTYQWYVTSDTNTASTPIDGATTDSYSVSSALSTDTGYYSVVVTNNYNSVTSLFAFVNVAITAPVLSGPTNQTVVAGNNANLIATLTAGAPAPTYQWYFGATPLTDDGSHIFGSTSLSLTITNVQNPADQGTYSIVASNAAGTFTNSAVLTVIVTPVITTQPTDITVNVGDTALLTAAASGIPTPSLQWCKNGAPILGQTGNMLTIVSAQGSDIGNYSIVASNAAGTTASLNAKLTVVSTTLAQTTLAPANGATGVCYDTPLYVTFNSAVSTVNSGKVRIYNANNTTTPVDVIDMSSNVVIVSPGINLTNNVQARSPFSGDSQTFNYFPVIISGTTAAIYPHSGVMTSNQTYYVTMDNGIFADAAGAYFEGIADTNAWRFSTKPTGPANPTNLVVAADGSGDFVTVQGAVDSISLSNTTPTLINIRDGNYVEIVNISSKNNVTFRGQSRSGTVVGYGNNNNINGSTHNRMAFKVNGNDIALENLTVLNSTPQGGQQAEALMIEGNNAATAAKRCIVNNADIISRQDTILANINASQGFFYNCRIVGNFDYVWGGGNLFFDQCVMHTITNTLSSSYNLTAARTDYGTTSSTGNWQTPDGTKWSSNGISIVYCTLEADAGLKTNITLAGANGTAGGLVSWAFCMIDTNAYVSPPDSLTNTFNFWQYQNTDLTGTNYVTFRGLVTLTNGDPRLLAVTNVTTWLYGWTPQLAPNIVGQPASQSVGGGQLASFTVTATGIPDPTYQWLKNGTNLNGQTDATLTISNAYAGDAGAYSVIVSNASGTVTSTNVTLSVGNTAPTLNAISDQTVNPGETLNLPTVANDPDVPPQTLTFSLTTAPMGASIDPNTGVFTWRPSVSQANAAYPVTITVTDNGSPNLNASQSFNVIVNGVTYPAFGAVSRTGGQFSLTVDTGTVGPDYIVMASTNLVNWESIFTNSSPSLPFTFTDTNAVEFNSRFYRIQLAP